MPCEADGGHIGVPEQGPFKPDHDRCRVFAFGESGPGEIRRRFVWLLPIRSSCGLIPTGRRQCQTNISMS
jgi:hypothetical protein